MYLNTFSIAHRPALSKQNATQFGFSGTSALKATQAAEDALELAQPLEPFMGIFSVLGKMCKEGQCPSDTVSSFAYHSITAPVYDFSWSRSSKDDDDDKKAPEKLSPMTFVSIQPKDKPDTAYLTVTAKVPLLANSGMTFIFKQDLKNPEKHPTLVYSVPTETISVLEKDGSVALKQVEKLLAALKEPLHDKLPNLHAQFENAIPTYVDALQDGTAIEYQPGKPDNTPAWQKDVKKSVAEGLKDTPRDAIKGVTGLFGGIVTTIATGFIWLAVDRHFGGKINHSGVKKDPVTGKVSFSTK